MLHRLRWVPTFSRQTSGTCRCGGGGLPPARRRAVSGRGVWHAATEARRMTHYGANATRVAAVAFQMRPRCSVASKNDLSSAVVVLTNSWAKRALQRFRAAAGVHRMLIEWAVPAVGVLGRLQTAKSALAFVHFWGPIKWSAWSKKMPQKGINFGVRSYHRAEKTSIFGS